MAPKPPHDWSHLDAFEEAHRKLEHYEGLESVLHREQNALSPNDHAELRRIGVRLTQCRSNIRHWTVKVVSANAQLRQDYLN